MKFEIIRWKIEWHCVGEVIEMDEKKARAYWENYLKPIWIPWFFYFLKDFNSIRNKAMQPKKRWRKSLKRIENSSWWFC